jgi:Tfp pilus assembly protein PilF
LAVRARKLAALDRSPASVLLAARALRLAGETDEADKLLETPLEGESTTQAVDRAIQLSAGATARGDLPRASALLEAALARAVEPADKSRLHAARAVVEEKSGRLNRAAFERAEAARLQ